MVLNILSSQSIRRGLIPRITLLTSVTGKNPSMLHQLVQCTEMRVPQDTFSIRTDCPIFPILFSLPSSFRTNSSRRTVFLAVCLEVSDVQESLRPVPAVSSARSANKQVPAACVMRKPILEDYLFYKELRQVLPERVDEILADEASAALKLGESVLDGSGAFIADTEEKKDRPSAPEDSDSDGENSYISCCRRDAGIEGERMIGCES